MIYSFFGTCADDKKHLFGCLKTMLNQTLLPKEIVLVDSGKNNIEKRILKLISHTKIKLVYIFEDLPRVKALNKAIKKATGNYLIRFDTRTRFSNNYAENSLTIIKNHNKKFVGGVPLVIPENKKLISLICSGIMSRAYIFLYPRHRIQGFTGFSSSVYLGCFDSQILKGTLYSEEINLISEDSLLATNLKKKGYPPYISEKIKIKYVSRSSLINIFKLFNTYGFCRANTIIGFKKIHSFGRYSLALTILFTFLIFVPIGFFNKIFLIPLMVLIYNFFNEIFYKSQKTNLIYPFLALICQIFWLLGFIYGFLQCFSIKKDKTNFIN